MNNSDVNWTRAMYGEHAVHVPAWMFIQEGADGGATFVGASRSPALRLGGAAAHQYMLGEIIVRPHFAVESSIYQGHGLGGLATASQSDFLVAPDVQVLCDPMLKYGKILAEIAARYGRDVLP